MTHKLCMRLVVAALSAVASLAWVAPTAAQNTKGSAAHITAVTQKVNGSFMRANEAKTQDWPSYGLDYAETRFSRLTAINESNVKDLGLVWIPRRVSIQGCTTTPVPGL